MRVHGATNSTHAIGIAATLFFLVYYVVWLQNVLNHSGFPASPAHRWLESPTTPSIRLHNDDSWHSDDPQLAFRLASLLTKTPPPGGWQTYHSATLQIAHAVLWHARASVRGGFVRDWVLRGEHANDIDVAVTEHDQSVYTVEQSLRAFLAESPAAAKHNVSIVAREQLSFALRLVVRVKGIPEPIIVDIQDPARVVQGKPSDADVNNLRISRARGLHILINVQGHTVQSAVENARQKQFVFFEPFHPTGDDMTAEKVVERLRKLLGRGWTCLSTVPAAVVRALPEAERVLVPHSS